ATQTASIQAGRINDLPLTKIRRLNPDIPFVRISSGQPAAVLAGGDLRLELGAVQLLFPNGRTTGDVHVEFLDVTRMTAKSTPEVMPQRIYAFEPRGISVQGTIAVTIRVPALYGSYDYLPEDGSLVVIVGFDAQRGIVMPIGVGELKDRRVRNVGPALQL